MMLRNSTLVGFSTSVLTLFLGAIPGIAQDQFNYVSTNGTITITEYVGPGGAVTIPSSIDGLPVTSVGDRAFFYVAPTPITSITIPDSVTNIGEWVFSGCQSATNIVLGEGVETIGYAAFSGCESLSAVSIPASVTSIGDGAFFDCTNLITITVKAPNRNYVDLDGVLFNKDRTTLVQFPFARRAGYSIPSSVTTVGEHAFELCKNVTAVFFPDGLTNISSSAFAGCINLTNVSLGHSITRIGKQAFDYCPKLSEVVIPNTVLVIEAEAFQACYGLRRIDVESQNSAYSSIDGVLFNKDQSVLIQHPIGNSASYTIPSTVRIVSDFAFAFTTNLPSVTIPETVIAIGHGAFMDCRGLSQITIPDSVTSLGGAAFAGCTNLSTINLGRGVEYIEDDTFASCVSLTSAYFAGNAPAADATVFSNTVASVYYLPGTLGWGPTFAGRPTAPWVRPNPVILTTSPSFGIRSNSFEFNISWATNTSVTVETTTDLRNPQWLSLDTKSLTNGTANVSDPQWTNHAARFYRLRSQ